MIHLMKNNHNNNILVNNQLIMEDNKYSHKHCQHLMDMGNHLIHMGCHQMVMVNLKEHMFSLKLDMDNHLNKLLLGKYFNNRQFNQSYKFIYKQTFYAGQ